MMLRFLAVFLNSGGGVVREGDTQEVRTHELGEFESKELAIANACLELNCEHITNGVLIRGDHTGGFMICDTQEFAAL